MSTRVFTSESVTEGHPDKICDQISDAVLDALIAKDPRSRVACETMVKTGMAIVAGEITTNAWVSLPELVREVVRDIGYTDSSMGFDANTCAVISAIEKQSPDISQGVTEGQGLHKEQGAGDQGMMFGYASDETPVLMPTPIWYAHALTRRLAEVRKSGELPWLRPDGKSQVSVEYRDGRPIGIPAVVVSTQHAESVSYKTIREAVVETVVQHVLPKKMMRGAKVHVNPTGRFVYGGPYADSGLTGRKIIVDTYGGMGRHGGGAFSGKDPSKVDRSAAYYMRYIAKNIVAAGLAKQCEVQVAYAIGVARPVGVYVSTFGTGVVADEKLAAYVQKKFDMRPRPMIEELDLLRPIYRATASYGHFGRTEDTFTWEQTDRAEAMADALLPAKIKKGRKAATAAVAAKSRNSNGKSNGRSSLDRAVAIGPRQSPPPSQEVTRAKKGTGRHAAA
jgi:S-adenosylmethionine synthetase